MNLETLILPMKTEDNAFRAAVSRATQLVSALVDAVGSAVVESVNLASDLAETVSKTNVVFGSSAKEIMAWGETAATAMGMSKNTALSAAATFGNLFRAMKIGEPTSAKMSKDLVKLAGDLASFNNMDPTEVLDKLRAGLSGETEPLRSLGVNLNQAMLEQKALEMALWDGNGALDAASKAQAAYALILEQTELAQGDFARTSEGLANQQRIMAAQWEDLKTKLGSIFLPIFTEATQRVNEFLGLLLNPELDFSQKAGKILKGIDTFVANIVQDMANAINKWVYGGGPAELTDRIVSWVDNIGEGSKFHSRAETAAGNLLRALQRAIERIEWSAIGTSIDNKLAESIDDVDWQSAGDTIGDKIEELFSAELGGGDFNLGQYLSKIGRDDEWLIKLLVPGVYAAADALRSTEVGASINQAMDEFWAGLVGPEKLAAWDQLGVNIGQKINGWVPNIAAALRNSDAAFGSWSVSVGNSIKAWGANLIVSVEAAVNDMDKKIDDKLREVAKTFFNRALAWTQQARNGFMSGIGGLLDAIQGIVDDVNKVLRKIITSFTISVKLPSWLGGGTIGAPTTGVNTQPEGGRASGGPIIAGQSYWVGEFGPELFQASRSGRVDANVEPSLQVVHIANWGDMDYSRLAAEIIKAENNV